MIRRVVLIGSGNVAESLAQAVAACEGVELVQLYARNAVRGEQVARLAQCAYTSAPTELDLSADLYLISVRRWPRRCRFRLRPSLPIRQAVWRWMP